MVFEVSRRERTSRRYRLQLVERPRCGRSVFRLKLEGERFVRAMFRDAAGLPVPGFTAVWDPPFLVEIGWPDELLGPVTCEIWTVR